MWKKTRDHDSHQSSTQDKTREHDSHPCSITHTDIDFALIKSKPVSEDFTTTTLPNAVGLEDKSITDYHKK